jgi:hypothetical protein
MFGWSQNALKVTNDDFASAFVALVVRSRSSLHHPTLLAQNSAQDSRSASNLSVPADNH